jgi:hypothetical protein
MNEYDEIAFALVMKLVMPCSFSKARIEDLFPLKSRRRSPGFHRAPCHISVGVRRYGVGAARSISNGRSIPTGERAPLYTSAERGDYTYGRQYQVQTAFEGRADAPTAAEAGSTKIRRRRCHPTAQSATWGRGQEGERPQHDAFSGQPTDGCASIVGYGASLRTGAQLRSEDCAPEQPYDQRLAEGVAPSEYRL